MHLVITTREDPTLPLARLRARGQLTEVRATDLRFTASEAAAFLNQVMGLNLSANDTTALEARTEGWIAGLQMAALALQGSFSRSGQSDSHTFIQEFSGSHRFVLDYLLEEVLHSQPEDVRSFLLQTAILERLSGPLCTAVTGQAEAKRMLEALDRGNLFVIPLDDNRHWYRYHHLFADVLQARLLEEQPEQIPILHQRAGEWYAQNNLRPDAIHHALAAEDFERAASLIELAGSATDQIFQSAAWTRWVETLPDDLLQRRPVLNVQYGWELIGRGQLEAGEARLRITEQWLESITDLNTPGPDIAFADEAAYHLLPATIAAVRTYQALALGDFANTIKYGQQALDLYPEDDYINRGAPAALMGIAQWASGDLEAAYQNLSEIMAGFQKAGNVLYALSGTYGLADIRISQGRLHEAIDIYEKSVALAKTQSESPLQGTTDLYLGLAMLAHEQGNEEAARQHLLMTEELGEQAALPELALSLTPYSGADKAITRRSEGSL